MKPCSEKNRGMFFFEVKLLEIFQETQNRLKKSLAERGKFLVLQDPKSHRDCYFKFPEDPSENVGPTDKNRPHQKQKPKKKQCKIDQTKIPFQEYRDTYRAKFNLIDSVDPANICKITDTISCLDSLIKAIDQKSKPTTKTQELGLKPVFDSIYRSYNSELIQNLELQYIYVTKLHLNCKLTNLYITKASWADADSEDQDSALTKSDEEELGEGSQELELVQTLKREFDVFFSNYLIPKTLDPRCH